MPGIPIIPYQKTQDGLLQRFAYASTGKIVDLADFVAYTNAELVNFNPPVINSSDTVNSALKTLDGAVRVLNRDKANKADLATVATSGAYSDLTGKPTIPTKVSDLTNDSGYITDVDWDDVDNKPSSFTPATHSHTTADVTALTGYKKATSAAEISASDTLNAALGKIQKTLDAKQNSADTIANAEKATKDASGNVITTTYATKAELSAIPKFKIEVVSSLPATGNEATLYLLKTGDESGNLYTEYVYVNNAWEELGTQALDLSGYALKTELPKKVSDLTNDAGYLTVNDKISSATSADSATSATKDSANQIIKSTYIKSLSASGRTITITKGDNTTSTITTQDTTYGAATGADLGLVRIGANITNTDGIISLTQSNVTSALGYTPPTQDTTYGVATQEISGLMSNTDKTKLDGIEAGANKYTLPAATSTVRGGVTIGSNITNNSGAISLTKANVTSALGYTPPTQDTTYDEATTTTAGLMSSSDKTKLNGIESGANKYVLPAATSSVRGGVTVGSNITNNSGAISLTKANVTSALGYTPPTQNTTYSEMTGATSTTDGESGLVPAPDAGEQALFLRGDGAWGTPHDTTYNAGTTTQLNTGTDTDNKVWAPKQISDYVKGKVDSIDTGVMSVTTGTTNGSISVDGTDVDVKGLGTGAFNPKYVHPTGSGNNHIPSGGSSGQILKYSADGTAVWANEYSYTHPTTAGNKHIPSGGSTGQVLKYGGSSGTATWATLTASDVGAAPSDIDTGVMSVATGSANGTLSVDGTDVAVKGLGSAAYTASTAYAAASHNQASSTINAMTGYSKPSATSAIATSDTLNAAIGKLEKALDSKQATLSAMTASEATTGTATTARSITAKVLHDKIKAVADASAAAVDTGVMSVTTGSANGTLSVDGTDVSVKGLGTGAYADAYVHPTTSGNKHIPSGGSSGQILKYSADGTAVWAAEYSYTHPTSAGNKHIPTGGSSGQVLKYGGSSGTASWSTLTAADVGALASNGTAVKATADASGNTITTTYATKAEVSAIPKFAISVVDSLPATGDAATIYLVTTGTETDNLYTEYIYVDDAWEKLGTQRVDLSGYALKSDITTGSANGTIAVAGTNVAVKGLASGAYATAYSHPTSAGNKHIPTGGSTGQVLKYGGSSGTATWANEYSYTHPASGATAGDYGPSADVTGTNNTTISVPAITVDANGHVTSISNKTYTSKDTVYTHPTSAGNKHIPTGGSSGQVLKYSASGTAAWSTLTASDVGAAPSDIDTGVMSVTTGSANGTLSVDGTDVAVKGLASGAYATAYSHPNSGVTADTYGPTANVTGTNNTTLTVPEITVNAQGHITGVTERTYTSKDTTYSAMTASEATTGTATTARTITAKVLHDKIKAVADESAAAVDTGVMSVATGSTNGTLSVDGTDVAVKGLGTAAYTASTAYAAASHGNHVPATQTANNAVFLRNDNSWQTVTPANIGAAASSHTHNYAGSSSAGGSATSAVKLGTARAIDGVNFDGSAAITHFGTCDTAAATAAKTVACTSFTLVTGSRIVVKFTVTNTAASPTLNVNSTGAKAIQYRGSAISAGYLAANRTYEFIYDGTNYQLVGDLDTNTTYSANNGISLSGTTFSNSGVRSIATGSTNGTISVNTGGTSAEVAVKGLASGAYASAYVHPTSAGNIHLPSGGASGNFLKWSSAGTGKWESLTKTEVTTALGYTPPTTNTTYSAFTAATSSAAGATGLVPAPAAGAQDKFLRGNATWATASDIINTLSEGSSSAQAADYVVCQYAGGGTTTTTYHRRPVSKVLDALTKAQVTTALGYTPPTTNTTYSAGTGISLSGTTFSNSGVRSITTGSTNGTISVNTNGTSAEVAVKGLASGAYAAAYSHPNSGATAGSYGPSENASPAHGGKFNVPYVTINAAGHVTAASTKEITLPAQYVHPTGAGNNHIPSGGSSGQFLKWSSSGVAVWAADNNTLNTAGSTDTSSKIFLIGATSQAANPQTYSDNEVYVTSGVLTTKSVQIGGTACTLQYNSTNKCVDFVFA